MRDVFALYPQPVAFLPLVVALLMAANGILRLRPLVWLGAAWGAGSAMLFVFTILSTIGPDQQPVKLVPVAAAGILVPLLLATLARLTVRKRPPRVQVIVLLVCGFLVAPAMTAAQLIVACGVGLGCV